MSTSTPIGAGTPLWQPSPARMDATRLTGFMKEAARRWDRTFAGPADYAGLHRWSVEHPEEFWSSVWDFGVVLGDKGGTVVEQRERMPGAAWFPQARLNFAENLLRRRDNADALVFWGRGQGEGTPVARGALPAGGAPGQGHA